MDQIGIEEIQKRALCIAKEFKRICIRHHIPYYMLGGTMLGAIRHKGFIPWDDDMDFGVPIEHYVVLISYLERELPFPYRCCSYKNHPAILHSFIKIEDTLTCIDDAAIELPLDLKLGVNIDVFPLNSCVLGGKTEKQLRKKVDLLARIYLHSISHGKSIIRTVAKKCMRFFVGNNPRKMQDAITRKLFFIDSGNQWGNLLGRWGEREIIPKEWYGSRTQYVFEDTEFVGLKEYDKYLSRLYGDYMLLPPKEKQKAHVDNVYLR